MSNQCRRNISPYLPPSVQSAEPYLLRVKQEKTGRGLATAAVLRAEECLGMTNFSTAELLTGLESANAQRGLSEV